MSSFPRFFYVKNQFKDFFLCSFFVWGNAFFLCTARGTHGTGRFRYLSFAIGSLQLQQLSHTCRHQTLSSPRGVTPPDFSQVLPPPIFFKIFAQGGEEEILCKQAPPPTESSSVFLSGKPSSSSVRRGNE